MTSNCYWLSCSQDSPTTSGPSPLCPNKYKNIEDALRKRAHTVSAEDVTMQPIYAGFERSKTLCR
ncbi:hypothetical protein DPMN_107865 [Dreissena polymorpha]|uniref:Uncharacterized protein n=1 Tax=Dreissena polymorpha TaxID=45954 RepID=A0A9D4K7Z8_DREPO|nr:hypothetical protein DPMN_107865 [Dreissena polymorpha]